MTAESVPEISVLVPAFNEESFLPDTLESIHRSFNLAGPTSYEIVTCNNNSTDRTADVAAAHGSRVVFEPHNQIAKARNTAAAAARGRWLIFLDADTLLNPALLRRTITLFRSGQVAAGGAVVRLETADYPGGIPRMARLVERLWRVLSIQGKLAAGSYLFCRRDAWAETGGFDESVYVSEELWFSLRLKRWCRKCGLRFEIVTDTPVFTSSRKLAWFTPWQLMGQFCRLLCWPWAMKRRGQCAMWYKRPAAR